MNELAKKAVFILGTILVLASLGVLTGKMIGASSCCGNRVCEVGETVGLCPEDCFSICGDAICQEGEALVCPEDCTGEYEVPAPEHISLLDGLIDALS